MRSSNNHLFTIKGPRKDTRAANERRAAIARAAMVPRDLSPAPHGTIKALRTSWRSFCRTSNEDPKRVRRALLGRVRCDSRGAVASLRRGDVVLVWDDQPRARTPVYTVWHPRNRLAVLLPKTQVDLIKESDLPDGVFCIPGRRDDGKDSAWFDARTRKRVPAPKMGKPATLDDLLELAPPGDVPVNYRKRRVRRQVR